MDDDNYRTELAAMVPAWPPRTVLELVRNVPDPRMHSWAQALGADFERVWTDCPEGDWMMTVAGLIAASINDEIGGRELSGAIREWIGDMSTSPAEIDAYRRAMSSGRYEIPPGAARAYAEDGEDRGDRLMSVLRRRVHFDSLLERAGLGR